MLKPGDVIETVPEKPAAGGTMLARHDGEIILVAGAIPGERARVRIDRAGKGVAYGTVVEVIEAHPERRPVTGAVACGGSTYAHIAYEAQCRLKGEMLRDGLARIAHLSWPDTIPVAPSAERGYRMRARLLVRDGRVGFIREGTHELCDAAQTGQLLPSTHDAIASLGSALQAAGQTGQAAVDLSENIAGDQRAAHMELADGARLPVPKALRGLTGFTGFTWSRPESPEVRSVIGDPFVWDVIDVAAGEATVPVRLRRHVRAFFQGNRHLLTRLVAQVLEACPDGPVIDLYAGVGLFGVCLAATGRHRVVAVEGHAVTAEDLAANAAPLASTLFVRHLPVERFLSGVRGEAVQTLILDPPRTGMSRAACEGAVRLGAARVVFVSCDVATLARDIARFVAAGYHMESIRGFDLFPNTPHVEALAILARA